jgi:hypothetical protein
LIVDDDDDDDDDDAYDTIQWCGIFLDLDVDGG